jgi:hypothetical protein
MARMPNETGDTLAMPCDRRRIANSGFGTAMEE